MITYKQKLIAEFQRLLINDEMEDLMCLLKKGNYCIELNYDSDGDEIIGEIPFGYIYDDKYFYSFEDYYENHIKNSLMSNKPIQLLKPELKNIV